MESASSASVAPEARSSRSQLFSSQNTTASTLAPNGRGKDPMVSKENRYQPIQFQGNDHDDTADEDESAEPSAALLGSGQADEENQPTDRTRRPPRKRSWIVYVVGLIIALAVVSISTANLILFLKTSTYTFEPTPDVLSPFCQPDKLPRPGAQPLPYPSDLLRGVEPIPIHSHNDYWRKVPLCTALYYGAIGVEADVWLQPDRELFVGHDPRALRPERTFRSLYIDPLVAILTAANADNGVQNGTERELHGVFDTNPDQTLTLLIDVKTTGGPTFQRVLEQLEPLRERGWLSTFERDRNPQVKYGLVTVVGTGNTPFEAIIANQTHRDVFFDAPLQKLSEVVAGVPYDNTNSYWASASIWVALGRDLVGVVRGKTDVLKRQIKEAHDRHLDVRYWDLPFWPIGWRNKVWKFLKDEGVDILNVDDLKAAAKSDWGKVMWN